MKTTALYIKQGDVNTPEKMEVERSFEHGVVSDFYDRIYYRNLTREKGPSRHLRCLARRLEPWQSRRILDIGCGTGSWLQATAELGAIPAGIDISQVALAVSKEALPKAELHCGPAEQLPFADAQFDFISCLGALEHFIDPETSLREMIRVARPNASVLFLVPNAGFLPSRLGLYRGTLQSTLKEEARSLPGWQELFESVGFQVQARWKDLHILSPSWVFRGPPYSWPLRAAQALALPFWPLAWQYQVYFLCTLNK